jgi:HlyD family secretion protein
MSKGPALHFCPSGDRIIRAEVEQEYAGRVKKGQKATVQDETTGAGKWTGVVIGVSRWYTQRRDIRLEPMQFNDVRTLEVIIRLDDEGSSPLRINQRVRVKLDGAE